MSLKGEACRIVAVALAAIALIPAALADDLSLNARAGDRRLSTDVRIPETTKPDSDQASSVVLHRVEDLEATKAAVNQGVVPKISLSVSSWVGEQVTVTK